MTSRIDNPSVPARGTPIPRKTEESDTRQEIQRHDPDHHRKKKDDNEEGGFKDAYEDLTDVSVPALRNFLAGLLDRMGAQQNPAPEMQQDTQADHMRPAANPKAAAAAAAYQTGAVRGTPAQPHAQPSYTRAEPAAPAEAPSALDQAAAGLERADVLALIHELDRLSARGIMSITMEKGDGFLGSIRAGIARALNTP